MTTQVPTTDHVIVISDLHITPAVQMGNFRVGNELVDWTTVRVEEDQSGSILVLNGDIVDFLLLESRPETIHLATAAQLAERTLARLTDQQPWFVEWRTALQQWLRQGNRIVLLPGNHDPEWMHPDTDDVLSRWLAEDLANSNEMGAGIEVWRQPGPWQAKVGPWDVRIGHGHHADSVNDIPTDVLHRALRDGIESVPLPAGSQLVTGPLSVFKQAMHPITGKRRFGFLDAVKPETRSVLLLLLYLDAGLVRRNLPNALMPVSKVIVKMIRGALLGGQTLSRDAINERVDEAEIDILARQLAMDLWEAIPDADRKAATATIHRLKTHFEQEPIDVEKITRTSQQLLAGHGLLSGHGGFGKAFLRAWLRRERQTSGAFFNPSAGSNIDDAIMDSEFSRFAGPVVVIAGHTHAARDIRRTPKQVYLNTGTWTRLLDLAAFDDSDEAMRSLVDQIEAGHLPTFQRNSWAEVTPDGPVLHLA